jgi:hypothetical protein
MTGDLLRQIHEARGDLSAVSLFEETFPPFIDALGTRLGYPVDATPMTTAIQDDLFALYRLRDLIADGDMVDNLREDLLAALPEDGGPTLRVYRVLITWALLRHLSIALESAPGREALTPGEVAGISAAWIREWFLRKHVAQAILDLDEDGQRAALDASLVRVCVAHARHLDALRDDIWGPLLDHMFADPDTLFYLGVNAWQGRRWLVRESLETLAATLPLVLAVIEARGTAPDWDRVTGAADCAAVLVEAAEGTGFDFDWMLASVK